MKRKLTVKIQDIMHVHSLAVNACIDLPRHSKFHKDTAQLQSYSYICAVVSLLNSKNLLDLDIEIDRGVPEHE